MSRVRIGGADGKNVRLCRSLCNREQLFSFHMCFKSGDGSGTFRNWRHSSRQLVWYHGVQDKSPQDKSPRGHKPTRVDQKPTFCLNAFISPKCLVYKCLNDNLSVFMLYSLQAYLIARHLVQKQERRKYSKDQRKIYTLFLFSSVSFCLIKLQNII